LELIKDHPALTSQGKKQHKHFSAELHLLLTLRYFGMGGNGGSNFKLKHGLGVGYGSVTSYVNRTVKALLSLENKCLFWPMPDEQKEIAKAVQKKYDFPFCVGFVDGTHLGLATRPEKDPEEYWTRKQQYALNVLLFCDHAKCIHHLSIGWPGSVHDNRVWKNSEIWKRREQYFSRNEYEIGDVAFHNSNVMVTGYKRVGGASVLPRGQEWFNQKLSKPRSKVENTIGIWKACFPWL
jgi:hypothetical protein